MNSLKALFALALLGGAVAANANLYDLNADFDATSANGSGPWSYGYRESVFSSRVLFDSSLSDGTNDVRYAAAYAAPDHTPSVFRRTGAGTVNGIVQGQVGMHDGFAGQLASLMFTVPEAGMLTLSSSYGAGDSGAVDIYVRVNGLPVYTRVGTTVSETFNLTTPVPVVAGDTLEVLLGSGGDGYAFDSTPVNAAINLTPAVPEPATFAVLGLGALGLVRRRRASRR